MKGTFALLGLLGTALANPMPQGVSSAIAPSSPAPAGCSTSHSGSLDISVVNVTKSSKRDLVDRQSASTLSFTLSNGVMKDASGRTGYIAANHQFQFDNPPQTGAIYTAGWSVCGNGSIALGGNAIFYQCLSGTFYNLYDQSQGKQCAAVYFQTSASGSSAASPTQASDGQPAATSVKTSVTQLSDGQPQATTAKVSQISDGQPQATTKASSASSAKVSQISDGQPQATTAAASSAKVSQISDGQPQATTAAASSAKVSQISDGQPQATTAAASSAKVSQISDGQPQATTAAATSGAKVSQISDGQPQATTAKPATYTGAADRNIAGSFAFAAGIVGAVALL